MRVFLHGFLGSPAVWNPFVAEGDFAPALMGHDPNASEENVTSFQDEVARLATRIEERVQGPLHLIGYSLGARLALGVAAMRKVDRLTLLSGRDGLHDAAERAQRIVADEAWAARFEACEDTNALASLLTSWDAQPVLQRRDASHLTHRLAHAPKRLGKALRTLSLGHMPVYAERVKCDHITLIYGYEDAKFRALGAPLAERLRARVELVEGAGHDLLSEAPDSLQRLLL